MDVVWHFLQHQLQRDVDDQVRVVSLEKKEIPALVVQRDLFSPIDGMGIDNDVTLLCLAEEVAYARCTHADEHLYEV